MEHTTFITYSDNKGYNWDAVDFLMFPLSNVGPEPTLGDTRPTAAWSPFTPTPHRQVDQTVRA